MPFFDKPLGPWRPDLGDLQHDGLAEAEGVYPVAGGYALHPKAAAEGSATIDAIARGAYCTREDDGGTSLFVGNASKLYQRTSTAFTDVSKSGGYSTAAGDHWEFAQHESTLVATNYTDSPQQFIIGSSTDFEDLNPSYEVTGVSFDGTDDYYTRGGDLTSIADAKVGTASCWFRWNASQGNLITSGVSGSTARFTITVSGTSGLLSVVARNAAGTVILQLQTTQDVRDGEWHHVAASWNLADSAQRHLYIDGVSDLNAVTFTNDTVDYASGGFFVGVSTSGSGLANYWNGGLAEPWFNTEYFDLSVSANLRKFIDASGRPVSLGADGSTPTGNQPLLYLKDGASGFATNLGTGGNLTVNSAPTDIEFISTTNASPKCRHIGVIGNFVFAGNTNDAANGAVPYRVQWSAIGDPDNWPTPGTTEAQNTQSDEEYLDPEYGDIRGIAGGKDFGLVFQENAITRFNYIGGTAIFEVDTYERGRGLIAPRAFAQVGGQTYFVSNDGVYVTDGVNVQSIGDGVIDKTLIEDIDRDNLNYFSTAVDYTNKLIYFSIPNGTGSDKAYIYNYAENRWSLVNYDDLIGDATASVGCVVRGFSLDTQQVPRVFALGGFEEENLLLRSQEFDNASWSKTEATVSANATTAPDGTTTADKIVESSGNNVHRVFQSATVTAGLQYTLSVYAKAAERTKLQLLETSDSQQNVIFDLSAGTVSGSGSPTITDAGDGWYRCAITWTQSDATAVAQLRLLDDAENSIYAGDGVSGLYLWGAQLNTGTTALEYAMTEGATRDGSTVIHKLREFDGDLSPFTLRTGVMEFPQITYLDGASVYGDNASTYAPSTAAPFKVYASESSAIGISGGESGTHTVTTTGAANARTGKVDFRISARTASFELSSTSALVADSQKIQKFRVYHRGGSQA